MGNTLIKPLTTSGTTTMSDLKKILIIDDEHALVEVLSLFLSDEGFSVDVASNGNSGLELALNNIYDVIISDINLPGMDGFAIYEELKKSRPQTLGKIIFVTGYASKLEDFSNDLENTILKKPFTLDALTSAIENVIQGTWSLHGM